MTLHHHHHSPPQLLRAFQSACQNAVRILHEHYGYSRERAQRKVWYELLGCSGDVNDDSAVLVPDDPEQVCMTNMFVDSISIGGWLVGWLVRSFISRREE